MSGRGFGALVVTVVSCALARAETVAPGARAETVDVDAFVRLGNIYADSSAATDETELSD